MANRIYTLKVIKNTYYKEEAIYSFQVTYETSS